MINFDKRIVSNLVMSATGTDEQFKFGTHSADTIDIVVDIQGWYTTTNSSLCSNDTILILGLDQVGADGQPVLSAVVASSLDIPVPVEIYIVDSKGKPVGETPAATAVIS